MDIIAEYKTGKRYFQRANLQGADLRIANLRSADLQGADLRIANLRSADLQRANLYGANLQGADLQGADLQGADLRSANLQGADLQGANLRRADLQRANLYGADLGEQWIIQGPCRSDGYWFFLQKLTGNAEPMVKAGCRGLTLAEARSHWETTRAGTPLGDETFAILDCLEKLAKARGLTC